MGEGGGAMSVLLDENNTFTEQAQGDREVAQPGPRLPLKAAPPNTNRLNPDTPSQQSGPRTNYDAA